MIRFFGGEIIYEVFENFLENFFHYSTCWFDWLIDWLKDGSIGWLIDWKMVWLVDCSINRLIDWLIDQLIDCFFLLRVIVMIDGVQ